MIKNILSFCEAVILYTECMALNTINAIKIQTTSNESHIIRKKNFEIILKNSVIIKKCPTIVYLTGGGYIKSDYNLNSIQIINRYNCNDYIYVGIKYRINIFSINFEKLCLMIDEFFYWVYNNIDNYGGDKNNIIAIGESAGGHILNYLWFDSLLNPEKYSFDYNTIQDFVYIATPFNITQSYLASYSWIPKKLFVNFFDKHMKKYSLENILIDNLELFKTKITSRILIIQGSRDSIVLSSISKKYYNLLKKSKFKCQFKEISGTHNIIISNKTEDIYSQFIINYLDQKYKNK